MCSLYIQVHVRYNVVYLLYVHVHDVFIVILYFMCMKFVQTNSTTCTYMYGCWVCMCKGERDMMFAFVVIFS